MQVTITINLAADADPNGPDALAAVDDQLVRVASTWTAPVYVSRNTTTASYVTDILPRTQAVTTDNVSPVLMPPRVL